MSEPKPPTLPNNESIESNLNYESATSKETHLSYWKKNSPGNISFTFYSAALSDEPKCHIELWNVIRGDS